MSEAAKTREIKWAKDFERLEDRLAVNLEKIEELRSLLKQFRKYRPRHSPGCPTYDPTAYCPQCNCGFQDLIDRVNKIEAQSGAPIEEKSK